MLVDGRTRRGLTKAAASRKAGLSPATWHDLENGGDARFTVATWNRAAMAIGSDLVAFLRETSAADQPRDAVHLRAQEFLIRTAALGGWRALPEQQIDRDARTSRWADVLLSRRLAGVDEYGLFEIYDWFDDVGAHTRDWLRRLEALERYAIARMRDDTLPRTGGCWVVRDTQRNKQLIADHAAFFDARFRGSGEAWLAALTNTAAPLPDEPALLWVSVEGDRLLATSARYRSAAPVPVQAMPQTSR